MLTRITNPTIFGVIPKGLYIKWPDASCPSAIRSQHLILPQNASRAATGAGGPAKNPVLATI